MQHGRRPGRVEIEAALVYLREVLSLLPPDDLEGQLRQLRERAALLDPQGRPAEPAEGEGPPAVYRWAPTPLAGPGWTPGRSR